MPSVQGKIGNIVVGNDSDSSFNGNQCHIWKNIGKVELMRGSRLEIPLNVK